MEDYKKKFEEAVERATELKKKNGLGTVSDAINKIFPELEETEDERTRLEIVNYIRCQSKEEPGRKEMHEKWIEWLERHATSEMFPYEEGDWLIDEIGTCIKINSVNKEKKTCGILTVFGATANNVRFSDLALFFRPWTISDATDGQILATLNDDPFIYNGCTNGSDVYAYGGICSDGTFEVAERNKPWTRRPTRPTTLNERQGLMEAIDMAGMVWDQDAKKLRKP